MISASVSRAAGGIFEAELRLSQELAMTPDVTVGVFGIKDEFTEADLPRWLPLRPQAFPCIGPRAFGYCPSLLPALEEWNADLAHLHSLWMHPSVVLRRWSGRSGRPAMITPHGMLDPWALKNSRWKKRAALSLFERRNLGAAGCIHVLASSEAAAVRALGLTNPIAVIPNGVDIPRAADSSPAEISEWVQGRKVLLYLGRIHPKKGLANLVRAWSQQRADTNGERWVLAIAGWDQGRHEQEIMDLATDLGIPWLDARMPDVRASSKQAEIVFLGPQFGADKDRLYRASDAFILPSFSEGLPMVVLEAWAYGKPVVMTPMCNLSEGFTAGAALRVEPEVGSIVTSLGKLFTLSDDERRRMGAHGRQLVGQQFSWPRVAGQMKEVYAWLLGGGQRPDCILA